MKFSICQEIFKNWDLEETFEYVSKIGYTGVEIAPFVISENVENITSNMRKNIRNLAEKYNLKIVGLHWLLVRPEGLHINHPEKEIRERTLNYFFSLIEFCSDISGRIMVIGSPKQRNITNMSYQESWEISKNFFSECAKYAKEKNVILCLEPLPKEETNFINTAEEAVKMIKEVNNENFKLILDVKSMCSEKEEITEIIKKNKEYLSHFHANDSNRSYPGSGKVDFTSILKTLKEVRYERFISVEVFDFTEGSKKIAENSVKYLKKCEEKIK